MRVLITKKLSSSDLDLIHSWGWTFEMVESLKINPIEVNGIPKGEVWVVSSRNSLNTIRKFIDQAPTIIYCVGNWMKEELVKAGTKSEIRSFENMKKLAVDLSDQRFSSILYFCGEDHRHELEDALKNSSTKILKTITHQSQLTFPIIKNEFDVVFVFSPRSAESLLKNNSFGSQTIFACIGQTTTSYVNEHGITNTFTASYPDSRILLEEYHTRVFNF
jgi:uroporphyrinogen-III synthase